MIFNYYIYILMGAIAALLVVLTFVAAGVSIYVAYIWIVNWYYAWQEKKDAKD